jgi:DUF1365 family protein
VYCYGGDGRLEVMGAEVRNTFGGLTTYWWPAGGASARAVRHRTAKTLHVSPFMPMHLDYEFVVTPPGETLVAHMNTFDRASGDASPNFDATLTLARRPWTARQIRRVLARHPLMTAKVIGAIHWQALRLWAKRLPFYPNPRPAAVRSSPQAAEERPERAAR